MIDKFQFLLKRWREALDREEEQEGAGGEEEGGDEEVEVAGWQRVRLRSQDQEVQRGRKAEKVCC